jgi:hypothetical protein
MVVITEAISSTGLRLNAQNVSWTIYIITVSFYEFYAHGSVYLG